MWQALGLNRELQSVIKGEQSVCVHLEGIPALLPVG